jgi:carbamate kinase
MDAHLVEATIKTYLTAIRNRLDKGRLRPKTAAAQKYFNDCAQLVLISRLEGAEK